MNELVEHLFRHEAPRLVATLTRALGAGDLALAEDLVQEAMLAAVRVWPLRGVPDDPRAWLARVARNRGLDEVRRRGAADRTAEAVARRLEALAPDAPLDEHAADDDVLTMMILCCHPALPREACVALTLKSVAGFGVNEIARAFLSTPVAIAQRLVRAKRLVRDLGLTFERPAQDELPRRLGAVLEVLYLVFNEGHVAHSGEQLVRPELCDEALRLTSLLAAGETTASPEVHALLALMHLVRARQPARVGPEGELVSLEEQQRASWDRAHLSRGFLHLDRSAAGDVVSRYHVEAGIAACHAAAPSWEATDWSRVLELYDALVELDPSPVIALNRTVALARAQGPERAALELERLGNDGALARYHLFHATRGEVLSELGQRDRAAEAFRGALRCPCAGPERRHLEKRLASVLAQ